MAFGHHKTRNALKDPDLISHGYQMAIAKFKIVCVWPFGLEGLWLRYATVQIKERKGSNFAIWQHYDLFVVVVLPQSEIDLFTSISALSSAASDYAFIQI